MFTPRKILIALLAVSMLAAELMPARSSAQEAPTTGAYCLALPGPNEIICNTDGTFTFKFWVKNVSSFPAGSMTFSSVSPAGVTITPSPAPLNPLLAVNGTRQIAVKISGPGAVPGATVCFSVGIRDRGNLNCCTATQRICIILPECSSRACASGICCAKAPEYTDPAYASFLGKKVAVVTTLDNPVEVINLSGITGATPTGVNYNAPRYRGPNNSWSRDNLGSVFGVTLDEHGNIYVAATSAYGATFGSAQDLYPNGSGRVYKIDNGTGAISLFALLPNFQDPAIAMDFPSEAYPGLGNISYDCKYQQLFVTNHEDGKIYRLSISGTTLETFDPFGADNNAPGFAPLDQRLWGVQVHNNRVYYSRWREDCGNPRSNVNNEVWSVALNSGAFVPASNRLELTAPDLAGANFSNPISDISFSSDGKMLLGERTMMNYPGKPGFTSATFSNAHASRVLEYSCSIEVPRWKLTPAYTTFPYRFNIGILASSGCNIPSAGLPANAAGGVDYDYDLSTTSPFKVWATGDALKFQANMFVYGIQGLKPTGGDAATSILIDTNGNVSDGDKTEIGDVEISCPDL
ncbi:MAG TPA: hypothetical protein VF708_18495 [Pyrinomonadaceae bacterium]|jgi:hypothetical protein